MPTMVEYTVRRKVLAKTSMCAPQSGVGLQWLSIQCVGRF